MPSKKKEPATPKFPGVIIGDTVSLRVSPKKAVTGIVDRTNEEDEKCRVRTAGFTLWVQKAKVTVTDRIPLEADSDAPEGEEEKGKDAAYR
jgi:hypothetical protein